MTWYRRAVFVFCGLFIGLGVAMLVRTVSEGGGMTGYVVGGLFVALGVARLTLERKRKA
jgi:hypothetical protein